MKQIIAGSAGFVGRSVKGLFPDAEGYDIGLSEIVPRETYDFCHICTPTPMKKDGSCDTSAVEDVVDKIRADVYIIRSTLSIGTIDRLSNQWHKKRGTGFVFQPEYVASSSPYPAPLSNPKYHPFIVLGGEKEAVKKVRRLYETVYPPTTQFVEMTALEAEICKLMENSFIGTYVTFCNEFFDICQQYKVDYDKVREGFLADPRMTKYWTYVYQSMRGWGGHCLPKDISNLIHETNSPFMNAVVENNNRHRGLSK